MSRYAELGPLSNTETARPKRLFRLTFWSHLVNGSLAVLFVLMGSLGTPAAEQKGFNLCVVSGLLVLVGVMSWHRLYPLLARSRCSVPLPGLFVLNGHRRPSERRG